MAKKPNLVSLARATVHRVHQIKSRHRAAEGSPQLVHVTSSMDEESVGICRGKKRSATLSNVDAESEQKIKQDKWPPNFWPKNQPALNKIADNKVSALPSSKAAGSKQTCSDLELPSAMRRKTAPCNIIMLTCPFDVEFNSNSVSSTERKVVV